jgi:hypothetical protein
MKRVVVIVALFFCLGVTSVHHKFGHQYQIFDYIDPPATCGELHTFLAILERRIEIYEIMGEPVPLSVLHQRRLLEKAFESNCAEI